MAAPLMAQITGCCIRCIVGTRSASNDMDLVAMRVRVRPSMLGGGPPSSLVSAPEQNPRPAPVSTTQVVSLSAATSSSASRKGTISWKAIEFIRSGRFSVMTVVWGRGLSIRTRSVRSALMNETS